MASDPQTLFATVICLLAATYNSPQARSKLPPRLTKWVSFLLEKYSLSAVCSEEASQPLRMFQEYADAEKPGALASGDGVDWLAEGSGWLEPNWLQWAWTVAGTEMVMIPLQSLEILNMEGEPSMLKQACLYVPQE